MISSSPITRINNITGNSHHFFLVFKYFHKSEIKLMVSQV